MPVEKLKLSRPNRLAHRLVKVGNAANSAAELLAETVVALQDLAQTCHRAADELEEQEKEKARANRVR